LTWLAWLKNAKSGRRCTLIHGTGWLADTSDVSRWISGESVFTRL